MPITFLKRFFALMATTLFTVLAVSAQTADPQSQNSPLQTQVEELRKKSEQLQKLVELQQKTLAELQLRLAANEAQLKDAASHQNDGALSAQPRLETASLQTGQGSAPAKEKEKDKPVLLAGWDKNHAFLRSADGNFETFLTGYAQLDFRGYQSGNHPANTFFLRRARVALEGKIAKYYDFKIEGDFADTSGTLLRDVYLNVHRVDQFQVRAGQFKEPFSQEELRSDAVQDFVERSLVNNLAPSRSPGLMVSGVLKKGLFEYQAGLFNGKGLLAANNNGTPEAVGRLRLSPWKSSKDSLFQGLSFGGAFARGRSSNGQSVRGQTESRSFTFFSPVAVNGWITRANGELNWIKGPWAFRAEYDQTNQARRALGAGGRDLPGVIARGYMGQFTYLLTGESKPDAGAVAPKRELFGKENGFGAWELKFRYSNLQISDGTARSNRAESFYFGANWYLNRFVRYIADFGVERFRDPVRTPRPGERNYFVVLNRVQLAF
jgi:phosphate-selective porin OprO and OprP